MGLETWNVDPAMIAALPCPSDGVSKDSKSHYGDGLSFSGYSTHSEIDTGLSSWFIEVELLLPVRNDGFPRHLLKP